MLGYYNVHVRGKNSRFPEHHWGSHRDDLCFPPDNVFSLGIYIAHQMRAKTAGNYVPVYVSLIMHPLLSLFQRI